MEWKDSRYNGTKLDLGIITVEVYWDSSVSKGEKTGYRFRYAHYTSKNFYADIEVAKVEAVKAVRKRLEDALRMIESE